MTTTRRSFLQQIGTGAAGLGLVAYLPGCQTIRGGAGRTALPRGTPEAEGVTSAGILAFLAAAAQQKFEMHGFLLVRHGCVVADGWWTPYGPSFNHTLYSMSKSFTSTAVGLAVAEGRLRVDDRVVSFFPGDLPNPVGENLAALRIKDLLTMSTGHEKEPTQDMVREQNWARVFLASPITHAPGSTFMYNSGATYMCSAIVQQVTGQRIADYLRPRLFEPLGIEGPTWETCPRGINTGGWGLSVPTEALAKFGQLYLQKGTWRGRQILPAAWVEEATTFKIQQPQADRPGRPKEQNDWMQGYGYQFWRSTHHAYRGDGAFGQYTIVMPERDAVVAIHSEVSNMQGVLDLVWEHLLPAMKDQPLAASGEEAELRRTLASLSLAPPAGPTTSPLLAKWGGAAARTFQIEANDLGLQSVSFDFPKGDSRVTFHEAKAAYPVSCGAGRWVRGETGLPGTPPRLISGGASPRGTPFKIATAGAWTDDRTFEFVMRYYETPHHDRVTCRFDGDTVEVAFMNSMAAMSANPKDSRPLLKGKAGA
jgi:CubicO group peptidase (beta-lactamase class C family)